MADPPFSPTVALLAVGRAWEAARFALHSATVDPVDGSEAQWPGEAKISGRAIAAGSIVDGPDGDSFHVDIAEVVHVHLDDQATLLVVEWWTPAHGMRRVERE
jgi:hypothetical protein